MWDRLHDSETAFPPRIKLAPAACKTQPFVRPAGGWPNVGMPSVPTIFRRYGAQERSRDETAPRRAPCARPLTAPSNVAPPNWVWSTGSTTSISARLVTRRLRPRQSAWRGLWRSGGGRLLAFATDNAAGEIDAQGDDEIKSAAVAVWPDRADFDPLSLLVAAFLRVDDDVGGVGGLAVHRASPSLRGRHNGASTQPAHGTEPCGRRGETREGHHPVCTKRSGGRPGIPASRAQPLPRSREVRRRFRRSRFTGEMAAGAGEAKVASPCLVVGMWKQTGRGPGCLAAAGYPSDRIRFTRPDPGQMRQASLRRRWRRHWHAFPHLLWLAQPGLPIMLYLSMLLGMFVVSELEAAAWVHGHAASAPAIRFRTGPNRPAAPCTES